MTKPLRVFVMAGELSGDRLGASLMQGLKIQTDDQVLFAGVGGPNMAAAGLESLFNMSDLSVMGLFEVVPKIPKLLSRIRRTAQAAIAGKPDVIISIDSPDFCLRVIPKIKEKLPDVPVVHYVAPSVWAWRPERAEKMAKSVDHVLALLPFEPPYMTKAGMSCDFVGHPAAFDPALAKEPMTEMKVQLGLTGPIVTLLPGSRANEIKKMAPVFDAVTKQVKAAHEDVNFLLPVAHSVQRLVKRKTARWQVTPKLILPNVDPAATEARKNATYAMSDAALATSGTVALELAAQGCPMVVAYRANWATTRMVKKLAQIDTANLVNIVSETRVIPEFLFENCEPEPIAKALLELIDSQAKAKAQRAAMEKTMLALGRGDPDMQMAAAKSVLRFIG